MNVPVYAVENLVIDLYTPTLSVRAVDGASFHLPWAKRLPSWMKADLARR